MPRVNLRLLTQAILPRNGSNVKVWYQTITDVDKLHGTTPQVVQDRIEAGTFMVVAMTGGDVLIKESGEQLFP